MGRNSGMVGVVVRTGMDTTILVEQECVPAGNAELRTVRARSEGDEQLPLGMNRAGKQQRRQAGRQGEQQTHKGGKGMTSKYEIAHGDSSGINRLTRGFLVSIYSIWPFFPTRERCVFLTPG
ncbi:MAG: hypothetical protein D6E12_12465 [Desulfovibrio sp.]|nr:MAG: hypothetical protein D6E12_12465 [Desulfovibrio sp.]